MKRLLGLLLVMGVVGCGQKENTRNAVDSSLVEDNQLVTASVGGKEDSSNAHAGAATSTPTPDVDPVATLKSLGARIERNVQGEVIEVYLRGSVVSDAALVHLKGLTNLRTLSLSFSNTDAGLVHLKGLTNLQGLWLNGTQITDSGLVYLVELTTLQTLNLNGTPITDLGLVHLESLADLNFLYLGDTQVTDSGLVHLKGMTNLKTLWLRGSQITDLGGAELKQVLPNCTIIK